MQPLVFPLTGELVINDFENNLREMGFGDVAVNKKMKIFISAFYGRISNYSIGVKLYKFERNKQKLFDAIKNNIYKNKKVSSKSIDFFVEYLLLNLDIFVKNSLEDNIIKKFDFISLERTK